MTEKRVKIGPLGQVQPPKPLRDALRLRSGDEVVLGTDGVTFTITPVEDPVAFFERLSRSAKGRRARVGPHESEREIETRHRRWRR